MYQPKECKCKVSEDVQGILLYAIVSFDYADKQYYLHAVDRTRKRAEDHHKMIMEEYRMKERRGRVHIETFESDHAFAQMMKI